MRYEDIDNKDGFYITTQIIGSSFTDSTNSKQIELSEKFDVFFIATKTYEVLSISEVHSSAGTGNLNIERLSSNESVGNGDEMLITDFALNSSLNTVITKTKKDLQNIIISPGDRLALKDKGTLTNTQNICITLYLKPLGKGDYR